MDTPRRTSLKHFGLNILLLFILFLDISYGQERPHSNMSVNNTRPRPYMPRRRTTPIRPCPNSFIKMGQKCIFISKTPASWTEAFHKCRDLKGELLTLEKSYEDRRIKEFLQKQRDVVMDRWIGGIYNGHDWTWGASGKNFEYEGFSKMRPPNITADEKLFCVAMNSKKNYRWIAKSCIEPSLFICQNKQVKKRRPTRPRNPIPNNNVIPDTTPEHLKNYILKPRISETQNDIAPGYVRTETRKRISLLNRVTRRCRNRDATVQRLLNYTNLSENDCIQYFIQRWNRKQKKNIRSNRTIDYSRSGPRIASSLIDRVTPKTIIRSRLSELHPAEIVETHDV